MDKKEAYHQVVNAILSDDSEKDAYPQTSLDGKKILVYIKQAPGNKEVWTVQVPHTHHPAPLEKRDCILVYSNRDDARKMKKDYCRKGIDVDEIHRDSPYVDC